MELYNQDCLIAMKNIKDKSIDCIIADLPFGTTSCAWDSVIPFDELWKDYERIIKDNGAIILFAQQPFTSNLIMSNPKLFRYEIIYEKANSTGFLNANKMPLKSHENICVFYKKLTTYNPQMTEGKPYYNGSSKEFGDVYGNQKIKKAITVNNGKRYPRSVVKYSRDTGRYHATQKPVDLLEYLIKTYSNENEIVLDNTMGSGSTGIACLNTNRYFIGIEMDSGIFKIAKDRIEKHMESRSVSEGLNKE